MKMAAYAVQKAQISYWCGISLLFLSHNIERISHLFIVVFLLWMPNSVFLGTEVLVHGF